MAFYDRIKNHRRTIFGEQKESTLQTRLHDRRETEYHSGIKNK
jgi:hypothetical protein